MASRQSSVHKVFANNLPKNIKLSEVQISKIMQPVRFLGRLTGPLMKACLTLLKNVLMFLTKIVLVPLGLVASASALDAGFYKKILGSGRTTVYQTKKWETL